ncbi:MAG: PEP/pyruvate-binding domain-containing protein, partial [Phycisphaerales bacterium]
MSLAMPPRSTKRPARTAKASAKGKSRVKVPSKLVYFFGAKGTEGDGGNKALLGGKGANLARMCQYGLPVPPGFTITTDVCTLYYAAGQRMPPQLLKEVKAQVARLEKAVGKKFGCRKDPLLVSVRSGARDSMPGMMDTILNLGLNDQAVEALSKATSNPRFAWDCYRRFVQMYGDVVMGVQKRHENEHEPFDAVMDGLKHEVGVQEDTQLGEPHLRELVKRFKALIKERTGKAFPSDPMDQLMGAVGAVFGSWMNERAVIYRAKYRIPQEWGTAVNVQAMVFGNMGDDSGTGVAFTRDPATGENVFYGEYLINAQGEDVVAGIRTPLPVAQMAKDPHMAPIFKQLEKVRATLE